LITRKKESLNLKAGYLKLLNEKRKKTKEERRKHNGLVKQRGVDTREPQKQKREKQQQ
jgi:hypothetical protein